MLNEEKLDLVVQQLAESIESKIQFYSDEDREFFIENVINEELTPQQIDWVQTTIDSIISDLRADDFDATGVSEGIKLNNIYKQNKK